MAEEMSNTVNLELNLGPGNGAALPAGGERVNEDSKKCENGGKPMEEDKVTEEKNDAEKGDGNNGSFFDCHICLDLAKDPVVTNCGHLYCWSCIYRWIQVSEPKECPVCKGEVSVKTVTPIYGRGKNIRDSEEVSEIKIPPRPQAKRTESLRAQLHRSSYLPTDIIRHFQDRLVRIPSPTPRPYLNRFMTSRGVRAEQNQSSAALVTPPNVLNDIDRISHIAPEIDEETRNRRSSRVLALRRHLQAQRPVTGRISSFTLSSAERVMDTYLISHALGRNQEQNYNPSAGGEDRDSISSIVGVINSESQVDNAAEIDSMLTVSTSSSVRRQENGSRAPDVDSADSVPRRTRRRLA